MDIILGHDEELDFGVLDLFFEVTVGLKLQNLIQNLHVCTMSHEPAGRF